MPIIQKSNILSWSRDNIDIIPSNSSGVYVLRNIPSLNGIIYIGSSDDIRRRLTEHWLLGDISETVWFDWYQTNTLEEAQIIERTWISQYTPKYNVQGLG